MSTIQNKSSRFVQNEKIEEHNMVIIAKIKRTLWEKSRKNIN